MMSHIKEEEDVHSLQMVGGDSSSGRKRARWSEFEDEVPGLIYMDKSRSTFFVSAKKDGIDNCEVNSKLRTDVTSSCNGLVLKHQMVLGRRPIYSVENILAGQALRLPPFTCVHYCMDISAIGYAAASMTYKVVIAENIPVGLRILTVGVDASWRLVRTDHLSPLAKKIMVFSYPVTTGGFVHWGHSMEVGELLGCAVLTLNLETEIITETPPPVDIHAKNYYFLSTGKYLSLFVARRKLVWQLFEMEPDTCKWKQLPDMCLEGEKGTLEGLGLHAVVGILPIGWLKYPELLALRIGNDSIIFYNFITCKIGVEKLSINNLYLRTILHKNTLFWPEGWVGDRKPKKRNGRLTSGRFRNPTHAGWVGDRKPKRGNDRLTSGGSRNPSHAGCFEYRKPKRGNGRLTRGEFLTHASWVGDRKPKIENGPWTSGGFTHAGWVGDRKPKIENGPLTSGGYRNPTYSGEFLTHAGWVGDRKPKIENGPLTSGGSRNPTYIDWVGDRKPKRGNGRLTSGEFLTHAGWVGDRKPKIENGPLTSGGSTHAGWVGDRKPKIENGTLTSGGSRNPTRVDWAGDRKPKIENDRLTSGGSSYLNLRIPKLEV